MPVNRKKTITTAVVLSLGLIAGGCSSGNDEEVPSSEATSASETRTVTDSEGTQVEVPTHPTRPATLHFAATEALLDLGVTPVIQGSADVRSLLPADKYEQVKDVPQVELGNDINVEEIAQTDPDIILAADMVDRKIIDQLREVAPVYVYTHAKDRSNWQGRGDQIADAMNVTTTLDDVKAELRERQESIADTYRDVLADNRAALAVAWKDGGFTVAGPDSMPGRILSPAGLLWDATTTELSKDIDGQEVVQSHEQIASTLADADVILYGTDLFGEPTAETTAMMETQAFKELPAVKSGKVFPIGKQTIAGYMDAFNALDFLEKALKELKQ